MAAARWVAAALLAMMLGGCSVAPPQPGSGGAAIPVAAWSPPPAPEHWSLNGRAALRAGSEAATVSVRWRSGVADYRLTLSGPVGAGTVRLEGSEQGVVLRTADGRRRQAASARTLLRRETGYDLPVAHLRWWVRGRAVPGLEGRVSLNTDGRPVWLEQRGWRVTYEGFRVASGHWLPERLSVERGEVSLRLAVRRWRVGAQ